MAYSSLASCVAMGQSVPSLDLFPCPGEGRGWSRWSLPPLPAFAISGSREGPPGHSMGHGHEAVTGASDGTQGQHPSHPVNARLHALRV